MYVWTREVCSGWRRNYRLFASNVSCVSFVGSIVGPVILNIEQQIARIILEPSCLPLLFLNDIHVHRLSDEHFCPLRLGVSYSPSL